MAVGDQDHGGVAMAVAAGPGAGGGHQPLDLLGGEVLARPAAALVRRRGGTFPFVCSA